MQMNFDVAVRVTWTFVNVTDASAPSVRKAVAYLFGREADLLKKEMRRAYAWFAVPEATRLRPGEDVEVLSPRASDGDLAPAPDPGARWPEHTLSMIVSYPSRKTSEIMTFLNTLTAVVVRQVRMHQVADNVPDHAFAFTSPELGMLVSPVTLRETKLKEEQDRARAAHEQRIANAYDAEFPPLARPAMCAV